MRHTLRTAPVLLHIIAGVLSGGCGEAITRPIVEQPITGASNTDPLAGVDMRQTNVCGCSFGTVQVHGRVIGRDRNGRAVGLYHLRSEPEIAFDSRGRFRADLDVSVQSCSLSRGSSAPEELVISADGCEDRSLPMLSVIQAGFRPSVPEAKPVDLGTITLSCDVVE